MSSLLRKTIFYAFVLIFILSGSAVIFYSFGWRINFNGPSGNFAIQKIGAISVVTDPKNVTIKIDDEIYPDASGLLKNGTLISNLLPKIYSVEIKKNGYHGYLKNIEIKPAEVSKLLKIRLIPERIKSENIIALKGNIIIDSADSGKKFIINNPENNRYYLYDIDKPLSTFAIDTAINNKSTSTINITGASFIPFKPSSLIVGDSKSIRILDVENGAIETAVTSPLAWTVDNSNIYFIKNQLINGGQRPVIYSYNLMIKTTSKIAEIPKEFPIKKLAGIKSFNNNLAFLNDEGDLYLFSFNSGIKKIAHDAKTFAFSPDGKKIAFLDKDGKLSVFFMEDSDTNTMKKSGDVERFELDGKEDISAIQWYNDSEHLFVSFKGKTRDQIDVKFMEIDNRYNINIYPIAAGIQNCHYDSKANILYLTENNELKKIDFNNI